MVAPSVIFVVLAASVYHLKFGSTTPTTLGVKTNLPLLLLTPTVMVAVDAIVPAGFTVSVNVCAVPSVVVTAAGLLFTMVAVI